MRLTTALLVVMALAACAGGRAADSAPPQRAVAGQPAPAFNEKTATGSSLALSSLRGSPVYLNFFATWCPPCNEEAPWVNELQSKYRAKGLRVVGVDVLENQSKAQSFLRAHHLAYPAVVDDGTLRDQYNINGLPVHVFIGRDGTIKKMEVGELSKDQMETDLRSIL